ncbi:hypothetical protein MCEMSE15_01028 [Fimbriimonadaceae bacterium]
MNDESTGWLFDFGILLATDQVDFPTKTVKALLDYCRIVLIAVQPWSEPQAPMTTGRVRLVEVEWTRDRTLALNTLLRQVPVGSWCFRLDSDETLEPPPPDYPFLPELSFELRSMSSIIEFRRAEYVGDELNCYSLQPRAWRQPAGDVYVGTPYAGLRYAHIQDAHPGEVSLVHAPIIRHQTTLEDLCGIKHPWTADSVSPNETFARTMRLRNAQPGQYQTLVDELRDWQPTKDLGDMSLLSWLCKVACDEEVSYESKLEVLRKAGPFIFRHRVLDLSIAFLAFHTGYISLVDRLHELIGLACPRPSDLLPYDRLRLRMDAANLDRMLKIRRRESVKIERNKDWATDELDGPIVLATLRTGMLKTTGLDRLYEQHKNDQDYASFDRQARLSYVGFPLTFTDQDIGYLRHVVSSEQAPLKVDEYILRMGGRADDAFAMLRKMVDCGPGTYEEVVEHFVVRFKREV